MVVPIHPAGPLVPSYATQPLEAQVEVGQWFDIFFLSYDRKEKNMFSPFCKLERRFAFEPIVNKDLIEIKIARNFTLRRCFYLSFTTHFNVGNVRSFMSQLWRFALLICIDRMDSGGPWRVK
jgi:hypothetical protein